MSQGLKNLQTHARAHARRERLLDSQTIPLSHSIHTSPHNPYYSSSINNTGNGNNIDDSGINLSLEDLEADQYDALNSGANTNGTDEGAGSERSRSVGSVYGQSTSGYAGGGHSHSSSGGSGGSRGGWSQQNQQQQQQMMANGMMGGHGRLPSMSDNMGIESIINRTTSR